MATTTLADIVLLDSLLGKTSILEDLKSAFGDATAGELFYNSFLAQLEVQRQETGGITYNPIDGKIYIGSGYDCSKSGNTINVAKLAADANARCAVFKELVQAQYGDSAEQVWTKLVNLATYSQMGADVESSKTALLNLLTDMMASYQNWSDSLFTTIDATNYNANGEEARILTFKPAKGTTILGTQGNFKVVPDAGLEGNYTVYGGTGTDTF